MAKQVSTSTVLLCVLFLIALFFVFSRCKLSCGVAKEGMSHRLPVSYKLQDNALARIPFPSYSEKLHASGGGTQEGFQRKGSTIQRGACLSREHCPSGQGCVMPGAYTGGEHGWCMSDTEPGVPWRDSSVTKRSKYAKEGYGHAGTCAPGYFYNDAANECQPRFQGRFSMEKVRPTKISIPGTLMPGYGINKDDPQDVATDVSLRV